MNSAAEGLCVDKVHVWRGERHVLRGVGLRMLPGELLHISGPNGTGKTTLLRVVSGLLRPESGTVTWRGQSIAGVRPEYYRALAYASHEPALKSDLTALENLRFAVGLKRRVTAAELRASLQRTGVEDCADLPARVLSFRAALWLLDEPFTNLDAAGSALMTSLLEDHVQSGGMALVVAHHELHLAAPSRQLSLGA
jgi:heme exporter protein A